MFGGVCPCSPVIASPRERLAPIRMTNPQNCPSGPLDRYPPRRRSASRLTHPRSIPTRIEVAELGQTRGAPYEAADGKGQLGWALQARSRPLLLSDLPTNGQGLGPQNTQLGYSCSF